MNKKVLIITFGIIAVLLIAVILQAINKNTPVTDSSSGSMSRRDTIEFDTVNATVSEPHTAEMGAFRPLIFLAR